MFAGKITLSDFFTIVNFFVLVVLGVYLFKRYFLESIREYIRTQEKDLQDLKQQKEDLRGQLRFLERSLQEQEQLGAELSEKIQRWHACHEQELIAQRADYERLQLRIQKKLDLQDHYAKLDRANRVLMPDIISESKEILKKKFESADAGREYITQILSCVERSKA